MLNSRKTIMIAVAVVVAAFAVVYLFSYTREKGGTQQAETQVWWIASDPHVGYTMSVPDKALQVGIKDVNEFVENIENIKVDHAAILGDLIHESSYFRSMFLHDMENLKVENWYYVLGNHDFEGGENILPVFYSGIDVMGIRFVFISTEAGGGSVFNGVMGDNQLTWLQIELERHYSQPVFLFSHQPYDEWNVWTNLEPLIQSEANLKVWFFGHLHQWVINENLAPYSFIEVCDSSLDWANNYNGVFLFLQREGGNVNVTIKFRNHLNHEWISVPATLENKETAIIENISFSVKVAK
jgi:predicted phosphodiesterase